MEPITAGLIAGGAVLAAKGAKHGATRSGSVGKALRQSEKEAAERLQEGGYQGLSDVQKRKMIGDVLKAQQTGQGGTGALKEEIKRTERAKGPLGSGQTQKQLDMIARAEGAAAAQAGGQAALVSTQGAQQQKAADIAAVTNAYNRRLGIAKELIEDPVKAGMSAYGQQSAGLTAGGEIDAYKASLASQGVGQ